MPKKKAPQFIEAPPVIEFPEVGSELAVEGAIGRSPTQDELRNLIWKFVTMDDVRLVIQNIIDLAKTGQPTAMTVAVRLLGLDVEGDGRQKSPAEGILEKIRDIMAIQKFPSLSLNLNLPVEELYGNIISRGAIEGSASELGDTVGGPDNGQSGGVPSAQVPADAPADSNPL